MRPDDLRAVAPLVLAHRARRHPLDPPGTRPADLDDVLDRALGPAPSTEPPRSEPPPFEPPRDGNIEWGAGAPLGEDEGRWAPPPSSQVAEPGPLARVVTLRAPRSDHPTAGGRRSPVDTDRGRTVGAVVPTGSPRAVAPAATVLAAAGRWAADPAAAQRIEPQDLREPRHEAKTGNLLVLAVDASGSMGADARMGAVKGALLGLLVDAYQRRDRVALVTFGGAGAEVVLRPTGSVEIARGRLEALPTGGDTPLADGVRTALDLAVRSATPTLQPLLVVVTDGRATAGADPWAEALVAAAAVAHRRLPAVVVDVEVPGPGRLGLAVELAAAMGARHLPLAELRADRLEAALRSL